MKRKTRAIVTAAIILALFGYLGISSPNSSVSYYMTVSELEGAGDSVHGKTLSINGSAIKESIDWNPEKQTLEFILTDGNETVDVTYEGSIPNNFRKATSVVVTGQYSDDNIFKSNKMLVKCPSKYSEYEIKQEAKQ